MKNLESINSKKFEVTENEMTRIMGGYGDAGTYDFSYNYYYTSVGTSGQSYMDQEAYDLCRDW
jgi:hypothetical protein